MEKMDVFCTSESNSDYCWFAMRATYGRNILAQKELSLSGIDSFVPMRTSVVVVKGKRKKVLSPVIKDLVFVFTSRNKIQSAKANIPYLHYVTCSVDGKNVPVVVPDYQMKNFIAVTSAADESMLFLMNPDLNFVKGDRVRIMEGQFSGCEGYFLKVKGVRNRRFVVALDNIIAVSIEIPAKFVELIN